MVFYFHFQFETITNSDESRGWKSIRRNYKMHTILIELAFPWHSISNSRANGLFSMLSLSRSPSRSYNKLSNSINLLHKMGIIRKLLAFYFIYSINQLWIIRNFDHGLLKRLQKWPEKNGKFIEKIRWERNWLKIWSI